jgi:ankyrin repeat protein
MAGGHVEMARWLLAHGANVNGLNFDGKTPLRVALDNDRSDLAALLIDHAGTA